MDRFHRGLIAGIAGGVIMNILSLYSFHILNFTDRRFLDWSSVVMFGHLPNNFIETIIALFAQLLWSGFLGIVFAYFIPLVTSRGYLIKGAFFGFITGFVLYGISILFKLPGFTVVSTNTVLSQSIGGVIWGLVTAYTLYLLDNRPLLGS
ncbi:MAG: hypothetical protein SCK28_05770 [Bacillota bacterium]|nr:hypothetical protein [Bacillota bacterium]